MKLAQLSAQSRAATTEDALCLGTSAVDFRVQLKYNVFFKPIMVYHYMWKRVCYSGLDCVASFDDVLICAAMRCGVTVSSSVVKGCTVTHMVHRIITGVNYFAVSHLILFKE